jgi:hypothetical protein
MILEEELLDPRLVDRWIERRLVVVDKLDLTAGKQPALQLEIEVGRAALGRADVGVDRGLGERDEDADLERPERARRRRRLRRGACGDDENEDAEEGRPYAGGPPRASPISPR